MKKHLSRYVCRVYMDVVIEAEDVDDAWEIAEDMEFPPLEDKHWDDVDCECWSVEKTNRRKLGIVTYKSTTHHPRVVGL